MTHHDDMSRSTREGAQLAANSFEQAVKMMQAVTSEVAQTTRAQLEAHTQFMGELSGARTLDRLMSVQTAYMRRLFEIVTTQNAQMQKIMGEAWSHGTRTAQEASDTAAGMARAAESSMRTAAQQTYRASDD